MFIIFHCVPRTFLRSSFALDPSSSCTTILLRSREPLPYSNRTGKEQVPWTAGEWADETIYEQLPADNVLSRRHFVIDNRIDASWFDRARRRYLCKIMETSAIPHFVSICLLECLMIKDILKFFKNFVYTVCIQIYFSIRVIENSQLVDMKNHRAKQHNAKD